MSLQPPSPNRSPSLTSLSDDEEDDIPDLRLAHSNPPTPPWNTSIVPPANDLPHELIIHILKFLPSHTDLHAALLVSRSWCQCSVELLWHRPALTKVSSLFKLITVLSATRPGSPPQRPLTFPYHTFLRRINFALLGPDCTDTIFSRLSRCTRLERLTLANCTSLTATVLGLVISQLRNLIALDLTNVSNIDDAAIEAIAPACTKVQGLNLSGCTKLTDDAILAIAAHMHSLRRVKLGGLIEVQDRAFAALVAASPLLIEFDLNGCVGVQDATPRALFLHSVQLRELRLGGCLQISDTGFPLPPLPHPAPLAFSWSQALNAAQYFLPQGVAFDHLRTVDLTSCTGITDTALDRLTSNSLRIRSLVLAKCVSLTEDCIQPITRLGKHLHYLHMGHVVHLTDRSIRTLAASCTRLRYIDLACCTQLTDMSVFELAALPKLRRVGLVRVTNLTDNALFALSDRHHTLERIHLSYCESISVQAVHYLLQRLHHLTHLSLTGVPAFRRPELQQFCRSPPREFSDVQQRTFCVYSGKGVTELRRYLASIASTPFPFLPGGERGDSDASTTPPPEEGAVPPLASGTEGVEPPEGDGTPIPQLEGLSLGIVFGTRGGEDLDMDDMDLDGDGDGDGEEGNGGDVDVAIGRRQGHIRTAGHGHTRAAGQDTLQRRRSSPSANGHTTGHAYPQERQRQSPLGPSAYAAQQGQPGPSQPRSVPRYTFGQTDPSMLDFPYASLSSISEAGSSSLPMAYPGGEPTQRRPAVSESAGAMGFHGLPSPQPHYPPPSTAVSSAATSLAPTPQTESFTPSPIPAPLPAAPNQASAHPVGTPDLDMAEAGEAGPPEAEDETTSGEERLVWPAHSLAQAGYGAGMTGEGSGRRESESGRRRPLEFLFRRGRGREGALGEA